MAFAILLPDAIRASRIDGHLSMEASPEHWSVSDYVTVGGILGTLSVWLWKKPLNKMRNMWTAPDRIEQIDKKLDLILAGVDLATAMSRVTWRALDRPVWQSDANGMCVHANPAMLRLLTIQEEEILGDGWHNIVHMEDRDKVDREWKESVTKKRDFYLSYRWVNASGDEIPIIAHASRLLDTRGNILGWVGFASVLDDER